MEAGIENDEIVLVVTSEMATQTEMEDVVQTCCELETPEETECSLYTDSQAEDGGNMSFGSALQDLMSFVDDKSEELGQDSGGKNCEFDRAVQDLMVFIDNKYADSALC